MLPLLLAGAGLYLWHRHKSSGPAPVPPQVAKIHGFLMGAEWNPKKLEQAAHQFRSKGFHAQAHELRGKAEQVKLQIAAIPDLCKRARANDQNAMGMIAAIREEAEAGSPRARFSAHLVETYCLKNPPPPQGPLGEAAQEAAA